MWLAGYKPPINKQTSQGHYAGCYLVPSPDKSALLQAKTENTSLLYCLLEQIITAKMSYARETICECTKLMVCEIRCVCVCVCVVVYVRACMCACVPAVFPITRNWRSITYNFHFGHTYFKPVSPKNAEVFFTYTNLGYIDRSVGLRQSVTLGKQSP